MSTAIKRSVVAAFLLLIAQQAAALTTLNKSDPYPLYTANYPIIYQHVPACGTRYNQNAFDTRAGFDLSIFGQTAGRGRNEDGERVLLGDLEGRWNILGLTYGQTPIGAPQSPILATAATQTFSFGEQFNDPDAMDETHNLGFMSVPLHYRKVGLRAQAFVRFCDDFAIAIQGGFADLQQTYTGFIDNSQYAPQSTNNTCGQNFPAYTCTDIINVENYLTSQILEIAQQLGYNTNDYDKSSVDDMAWSISWRHAFECNACNPCWDRFLFIPFIALNGRFAIANVVNPTDLFALSVGNNGYNTIGIAAGLHLDFYGTLEVGATAGFDHFFSRSICNQPMPTNALQSGIFPCTAAVTISPGRNFFIMATMYAHDFLDRLSVFAEYAYITHANDTITLAEPDPLLLPGVLEARSDWTSQTFNVGASYVMCPCLSFSLLWQAPVSQRNTYRSNTILGTLGGYIVCGVTCCF